MNESDYYAKQERFWGRVSIIVAVLLIALFAFMALADSRRNWADDELQPVPQQAEER